MVWTHCLSGLTHAPHRVSSRGGANCSAPESPYGCHPNLPSSPVLHLPSPAKIMPVDLRASTLCFPTCWTSIVPLNPVSPLVSSQAEDTNEEDTCESFPPPLAFQSPQPVLEIPSGFIFCHTTCSGRHSPPWCTHFSPEVFLLLTQDTQKQLGGKTGPQGDSALRM